MSSSCGGVISDQLNNNHLRRTTTTTSTNYNTSTTTNQVWFCVSFKIPHHLNPKTNHNLLMIQNQQVFRSSSSSSVYRLRRTKATIKEETDTDNVLSSDEEEEEEVDSFYQLLGISESGSFSEIKQAYKQLARKYHPDVSPPDRTVEYTKRFIQVHEAYEILSDPNTRAMYDRGLLHLAAAAAFSSAPRRRKPRNHYHHHQEGVDDDDERSNWKNCWQTQLSGLKKKKNKSMMNRDDNMSWGARMRRQRNQHSQGES